MMAVVAVGAFTAISFWLHRISSLKAKAAE
jgi:hypothetical protein